MVTIGCKMYSGATEQIEEVSSLYEGTRMLLMRRFNQPTWKHSLYQDGFLVPAELIKRFANSIKEDAERTIAACKLFERDR